MLGKKKELNTKKKYSSSQLETKFIRHFIMHTKMKISSANKKAMELAKFVLNFSNKLFNKILWRILTYLAFALTNRLESEMHSGSKHDVLSLL